MKILHLSFTPMHSTLIGNVRLFFAEYYELCSTFGKGRIYSDEMKRYTLWLAVCTVLHFSVQLVQENNPSCES